MAIRDTLQFAGKVALWGGESGIIVTLAGVVPVLFLGTYVLEDVAAVAMLAAYGLLFGHYLARRLGGAGIAAVGHARLLRLAPPAAMIAGYTDMRLVMGLAGTTALSALDGIVFGGLAGMVLGLAVQRLPPGAADRVPGPASVSVPLLFLGAGAAMGLVAGSVLSVPLGWTVAIPVWQTGMGAAIGYVLAPAPAPA